MNLCWARMEMDRDVGMECVIGQRVRRKIDAKDFTMISLDKRVVTVQWDGTRDTSFATNREVYADAHQVASLNSYVLKVDKETKTSYLQLRRA